MPIVEVVGGHIDLVERGAGKPLLLLHSLLADRSVFDDILPILSENRRVLVPDLPGFGGSSGGEASVEEMADRIAGLFTAMELERCDVLGNGLGAFVATAIAVRHGEQFDRLVLVGVGTSFPDQGKAAFRKMADASEVSGMSSVVDVAMLRLFPEEYISANPTMVKQRREAFLRGNPETFATVCRALAQLDFGDAATQIANPTMLVVGSVDAATPPAMAHDLASRIKGAEVIELVGIGHAPMAQAPSEFIVALSDFLELNGGEALPQHAGTDRRV